MKTVKVQLRVPEELHIKIVDFAKKCHRSMNGQIVAVLAAHLEAETKTPELLEQSGAVKNYFGATKHG